MTHTIPLPSEPNLTERWQVTDALMRNAREFNKREIGKPLDDSEKAELLGLVDDVGKLIPTPNAVQECDVEEWDKTKTAFRNQIDIISKRKSITDVLLRPFGLWKNVVTSAGATLAPPMPVYDDKYFMHEGLNNVSYPRRMEQFGTVFENIARLVGFYETSPDQSRENFLHIAKAMQPYRIAVHAIRLHDQLRDVNLPDEEKEKAIKEFTDNPLYEQFLQGTVDSTDSLGRYQLTTLKALLNRAFLTPDCSKPIWVTDVARQLRKAAAKELMRSPDNDKNDYAHSLAQAIQSDITINYQGDSAKAIERNPGASNWLAQISDYRLAIASNTVRQLVENFQSSFRPTEGPNITKRSHIEAVSIADNVQLRLH